LSGRGRFRMLESIREYAIEQLYARGEGEGEQTLKRHAGFYLTFAQEVASHATGSDQAAGLETLEEEHDNLRAALSWLLEEKQEHAELERVAMGAELCAALFQFWGTRGHMNEGRSWFGQAARRMEAVVGRQATRGLTGSDTPAPDDLAGMRALWAKM